MKRIESTQNYYHCFDFCWSNEIRKNILQGSSNNRKNKNKTFEHQIIYGLWFSQNKQQTISTLNLQLKWTFFVVWISIMIMMAIKTSKTLIIKVKVNLQTNKQKSYEETMKLMKWLNYIRRRRYCRRIWMEKTTTKVGHFNVFFVRSFVRLFLFAWNHQWKLITDFFIIYLIIIFFLFAGIKKAG